MYANILLILRKKNWIELHTGKQVGDAEGLWLLKEKTMVPRE